MLRKLYDDFDQKVTNIHNELDLHHSYKKSVYLEYLVPGNNFKYAQLQLLHSYMLLGNPFLTLQICIALILNLKTNAQINEMWMLMLLQFVMILFYYLFSLFSMQILQICSREG